MLKSFDKNAYHLDHFDGPLDFLLYLVQKKEIDLTQIFIRQIIEQYLNQSLEKISPSIDSGGEFLALTSYLLFLKSQALLPSEKETIDPEEIDPKFEVIHQLIEYCKFKDIAKEFTQKEKEQHAFFHRGGIPKPDLSKKQKGLRFLELQELSHLFEDVLKRQENAPRGKVTDEPFLVSDKILELEKRVQAEEKVSFESIFSTDKCKEELIVYFLALLELLKLQKVSLVQEVASAAIFLQKKEAQAL